MHRDGVPQSALRSAGQSCVCVSESEGQEELRFCSPFSPSPLQEVTGKSGPLGWGGLSACHWMAVPAWLLLSSLSFQLVTSR